MWKCKPFGWLWGLPLLGLLGLMVFFGERRNIEYDLTDRVSSTLEKAGLGWAKPSFAGRDGVLTGTAGSVKEREVAVALAETTWGVRIVDEKIDQIAAKAPEPAPAPVQVPAPVAAAVPAPAPVPAPVVEVPDIRPYVWRADYHANRVTLSGNIPDETARAAITAKAKEKFPAAEVTDQMEVGKGAPANWADAANVSLAELSQLNYGSATVWDNDVTLRGRAESEARRGEVLGRINSTLPTGYVGQSHDIGAPEPVVEAPAPAAPPPAPVVKEADLQAKTPLKVDECQTYLNSILGHNVINFKTASAELAPESFQTLIGLSHVANRCPDTRIEIAGHTDSDGSARFNELLSLRRARAVVQYLTQEGVAADRLSAVGYGRKRPLVPNTSSENKAKNRRIEFSVMKF